MITNPSELLSAAGLSHAISEVKDGNMSLSWEPKDEVVPARKRFLKAVGLELDEAIGGRFDGSTDIVEALGSASGGRAMREALAKAPGDAVITNEKGLGIFVFLGDCPGAILYDPQQEILGIVHLSRHTSDLGIARKIVESMIAQGSDPADIVAWISPGIQPASYVFPTLPNDIKMDWSDYLIKVDKGTAIDVSGFNRNEFIKAGLLASNIEVSPINTRQDRNYFSHRRSVEENEPEGRFAIVAVMR